MRGVYFMANDAVYEMAVAFLNSFRLHNPVMPLCLIPFDHNIQSIGALRAKYAFELYDDADCLSWCDQLSRSIHRRTVGHYRKLAAWRGPFDSFVYIDCDTVVIRDLTPVFEMPHSYDVLVAHSNVPSTTRWTWDASAFTNCDCLQPMQKAFCANTGFIRSNRDVFTREQVENSIVNAADCIPYMNLDTKEQPFLNYLIVTSGVQYSSLSTIAYLHAALVIKESVATEYWAGNPGATIREGSLERSNSSQPVLFVHWSGQWARRRNMKIVNVASRLSGHICGEGSAISLRLPYRALWLYYRRLAVR
jgi:hypothetical protein